MMVLSLCQRLCPDQIPVVTAHKLGDGADGEVFEIENTPDKVIKFCIIYERFSANLEQHYNKKINPILNYLITSPVPTFARVYAHEYMGTYSRDFVSSPTGKQKFIIYYYVMEKLNKISEDEQKVFHSILSHEDRGVEKNYPLPKIKKMLEGQAFALDFDEKKVMLFCENLRTSPVRHLDIHVRNVMKDQDGNFKLIDFDRCLLTKK
jgi:hypothetical protein